VEFASLFPSHRDLQKRTEELEREVSEMRLQTRAIENERNGLAVQLRRLTKELDELRGQETKGSEDEKQLTATKFERDELRTLYDKVEAQRATLDKELHELRSEAELNRERLWAPPGHFYSPITDPNDPLVRQSGNLNLDALSEQGDLAIDEKTMVRLLGWLGENGQRFPFTTGATAEWRYYTGNGHFGHADGAVLFSMLMEYKPARCIEFGCGFSSLLIMDVNDHFLEHSMEMTLYDPRPDIVLSLLAPHDPYRERVQARRSREIPNEVFTALRRGDLLSLETSHVAKTGSDVTDLLSRVLPLLAPGVLIHIHDIFYPFDYPEAWVVQDNRSWNEGYLLRAFLQYNPQFRVLFFNNLIFRKYFDEANAAFPGLEDTHASSIWIEKLG
jgi:regulator of replication initiation timing